ncbi:fibronectin type III domain-containing protein 7-like [Acanthochromis polyacanthus]|uniref:fibronectin type III domain-containing protein 7-like n=1 Tax=Acanthochromis polyacanthus TaxID=80966 RepID=UPI0022342784|nr:fibronectin type III domain-containing protein 7-like [Acanthochromis polyacanthus]
MVNSSCEDHSVLVSWTPSPVAEMYHVVAVAADGHVHTCNTSSSNCSVSELHCDQQYTVSVTASHENCSSKASQNTTVHTGPCQPSELSVILHCTNQSAMLTWTPSDNAVQYYGCAQTGNGDMLCCHGTNPTCTINNLDCGTVYNFSVQASDGTCNSSFSVPEQRGAAPCPPEAVEVKLLPMQMEIQVMQFNWTAVSCGDTEYLLALTGSLLGDSQALFEITSYWTNRTNFEIPLPCGSSYNATVQSRNTGGTSSKSVPLSGTTAPCPPSGAVYSGNSSFATVSWNTSVFATRYTVFDNSVTPKRRLCSVPGLSCSLSNISSNNLVITASNTAGESEQTNVTTVVAQGRRRRDLQMDAPLLDVTQPSATVVSIEWSEVEAASYYSLLIYKQDNSNTQEQYTVYGESIILTDLSTNTAYCFSVLAVFSVASGPESERVCVQTG